MLDALGGEGGTPRSGVVHWTSGAAVPGIVAAMTGVEAFTFGLAAALAVGTIAFRASVPPAAAAALLTAAAAGFFMALLHWGRWLPW